MQLLHKGKVRELYDAGDGLLLLVASDRVSAFDVVMAEPVPDKGRVLTAMSVFWFEELADVVPNHLVRVEGGRELLVRRAEMLPLECVVRGHLAGSAWKEYRERGTIHGEPAPPGLAEASPLPEPRFTPSTKAPVGEHDENIGFDGAVALVGGERAEQVRDVCLRLFARGAARAAEAGIVVADTKFELGLVDGELVVADEVLTPDSSRFWPADAVVEGTSPPSFDKQPLRDFLDGMDWDKRPPPPALPDDVVAATRERYVQAYERISGRSLADWP
jgi:phosphoribosylaminoimidazole-succinocarboxamide synthase